MADPQNPFGTDPHGFDNPASWPARIGEWLLDLVGFIGVGIGGAQASAAGWIAALQKDSLYAHGDVPLSPERLAEATLKNAVGENWAQDEAKKSGITGNNFGVLLESIGNPPGPGELLDLWRRGDIDQDRFELGLRQGYFRNDWIDKFRALRRVLMPVGELVAAVVQDHLPNDLATDYAGMHGVGGGDFAVMVQNAGNPPGPMEVLDLWRRGVIDEATVDQALRESRLKNKYIDALKKLAIRKIPMRTITTLVGHGVLTDELATQHLRELGYAVEDAAAIVAAAHHAAHAAHKELSATQITTLYADRAVPRDVAVADLVTLGYAANIAGQLLDLADSHATARLRQATITKLRAIYTSRRSTRPEVVAELDKLGVDPAHRAQLLDLWDLERTSNVRTLTEAQIVAAGRKKLYTEQEVLDRLVALGYSGEDAFVLAVIGNVIELPPPPAH